MSLRASDSRSARNESARPIVGTMALIEPGLFSCLFKFSLGTNNQKLDPDVKPSVTAGQRALTAER